ncbi:hypothetical protein, conserved [Babesia bigemina]|uniref:Uncharacterized protein n=1 Tax=Babesia bigemina TaxID=5866 RepID=A0A061BJY9_BABBI|nr:hypothetical protein, conserved [Babesia bigemina]CDR71805.1 hypothetical protein, conserved [Babesia bigemina]|eukprot:XP_012770749.1 hypothetical protein, conserved [Babesia bigemina]
MGMVAVMEAIEKATKSLQAEKNKLECPVKYKGNESTCQYYQRKIDELEKPGKSGENSNGFSSKHFKDAKQKCVESHESKRSDSQKKAYDEITEREKQLEDLTNKLKKFTESLAKTNNENILVNLCDGLETFLGYDKTSKGYTGQGIVYSDLDRLGDGVMGFLSGVLGAVKNTQTYNAGKNTLNSVSNEIKKHLCSGHDGFTKLLPILTQGIERYNIEVRESNEKVKKPIEDLLNQVGDAFKDKVQNILSQETDYENVEQVKAAEKQIKNMFRDEIKTFNNTFNNAYNFTTKIEKTDMKIAIHYLNSSLQLRVKHGVSNVAHEIKRLEQVADKESKALEETKKKISATLSTLTSDVDCKIDAQIQAFVRRVKEMVNVILNELTKINSELLQHIDTLQNWIAKADNVIKESLKKVDEVLKEVKWDDPNKFPKKIEEVTNFINIYAGGLYNAGKAVTEHISGWVDIAKDKITKLETGLKDDLVTVREAIKAKVTAVKNEIGKLCNIVKEGRLDSEIQAGDKKIAKVIEAFEAQIKDIKRDEVSGNALQWIVRALQEYATKFTNKTFEDLVLKEWSNYILESQGYCRCGSYAVCSILALVLIFAVMDKLR